MSNLRSCEKLALQNSIDIDFVSYGYFNHSEINSIPNHISYPMK